MTFLPIVERELRVAARRRTTSWTRFLAALTAIGVGAVVVWSSVRGVALNNAGQQIFVVTSMLMFGFSLLAGIFLTADCLCTERREGTLGLLFLTDLRGHDVVLGKLAATSATAANALLAAVPVLSVPLLIGGTVVAEFARMALALGLTLLLSLATGLLMSTLCRDTKSAMLATLGVLTGLTGGLFLVTRVLKLAAPGVSPDLLMWPNPLVTFVSALEQNYAAGRAVDFWGSSVCLGGMALAQLALASGTLPRTWQQSETGGKQKPSRRVLRRKGRAFGIAEPFFWLASREKFPGLFARLFFGALLLVWAGFYAAIFMGGRTMAYECLLTSLLMAFGLHIIVKVMLAVQASRRFTEDARSGALELLLATPLSVAEIINGQWRALNRQFRPMLWILVSVNFLLIVAVSVTHKKLRMNADAVVTLVTVFLGGVLLLVSDFHSISWVGMRQGARDSRHHRVAMATLLRLLPLPWLGIFLFVFLIFGTGGGPYTVIFLFYLVYAVASVVFAQAQGNRAKDEMMAALRLIAAGEKVRPQPWLAGP
jgi:ABC-type transport system involved in multi-copper enzyme maturation permease subunit